MLDVEMLKDVVLDHRLPIAAMLSETAMSGAMTPGGGAATPYVEGGKTPMVPGIGFEDAPWSPIQQGSDDTFGGATAYGGYGQTPLGAGLSPGCALVSFAHVYADYRLCRLTSQPGLQPNKPHGIRCWRHKSRLRRRLQSVVAPVQRDVAHIRRHIAHVAVGRSQCDWRALWCLFSNLPFDAHDVARLPESGFAQLVAVQPVLQSCVAQLFGALRIL
jgi:hypothetical protein